MDNRPIGIFDSGIGGISVLHQAMQILPKEKYIYYADTKNVPYGLKNSSQIKEYVYNAVSFFLEQDVKSIVIACNTATSVCIKDLREKYDLPIIGIEPAVKLAIDNCDEKRTLLLATPVTIKEKKLHDLLEKIDTKSMIDLKALPRLVEFAENEEFESLKVEQYLKNELSKYNLNNYSQVILGCTHFNYFIPVIKKVFPGEVKILDGNKGTVNRLYQILKTNNLIGMNEDLDVKYYFSGELVQRRSDLDKIKRLHNRL